MAFETWFSTTVGLPIGAADTTITVAVAPTVTAGRMKIGRGQIKEWISFSWVSGLTLTWCVRWLSKTADPATAWTGLSWLAGSPIKLVAMHDQLTDKQAATTTFNDVVVDDLAVWWELTFTGTDAAGLTIKTLTEVQRDALTPSQGMKIINSTTGTEQTYIWWSWIDAWVSGIGNASETVAGKVELSTLAERQAGTSIWWTWARLVPTNDALTTTSAWAGSAWLIPLLNTSGKLDNSFLSVASDAIVRTFTAWEGMSTGQIFRQGRTISYPWDSISQLTSSSVGTGWAIGYDNTLTKEWQSFTSSGWLLTNIGLYLWKQWTPASTISVVVRDSASGAGAIVATSTTTLSESSITATAFGTATLFNFAFSNIELAPWTYYIDVSVPRANSAVNYSNIACIAPSAYAWGTLYNISNTGVWSAVGADMKFTVTTTAVTEVNTKVYKANSQSTTFNKFLWAVQSTVVTDATFNWVIWWVVAWYTGQTVWEPYFLKDDWTTGTTPWTVSTKVWRALSATEINLIPL